MDFRLTPEDGDALLVVVVKNDFMPGTRLDSSADMPYLDCAYKLQEYAGIPRRKRLLARLPGQEGSRSGAALTIGA